MGTLPSSRRGKRVTLFGGRLNSGYKTALRRTDIELTRLRIGHSRFAHWHLSLDVNALECPSCKVPYSVRHILMDCSVFNLHGIAWFPSSVLSLSDLVEENPHLNLFAFLRSIGVLYQL
ncbi:RNase H domain-containing protein [Trichonephila clavipes]|nr:RNase H domain-containing protein [Trichonephila clavipes]